MFDIALIRQNPKFVDETLLSRGALAISQEALALDRENRDLQTQVQELLSQRNAASKQIGMLKQKGEDASAVMAQVAGLKTQIETLEIAQKKAADALFTLLSKTPNMLDKSVPIGQDEDDNIEIERWGTPKDIAAPKDHVELAENLGLYHPELAAKLSGARFTVLTGDLARMERALGQFMLDHQVNEFGFTEVSAPILVNDQTMFNTTQLPKFKDDQFQTTDGRWMIPTAEVPLTNFAADHIFSSDELPLRLTALTPCFRSEAGSAGRDTRGMIRQHQFWKVEMVSLAHPDASEDEHMMMKKSAQSLLEKLDLPYRIVNLCSGDIGFASRKTYDLEVWVPSQNTYREISSCSNCGDFQARRMKARFKEKGEKQTKYIHTLNGSGLAVGRCLVAIIENYQQADGSIKVPEALVPYMQGVTTITKA